MFSISFCSVSASFMLLKSKAIAIGNHVLSLIWLAMVKSKYRCLIPGLRKSGRDIKEREGITARFPLMLC